MLSKDTFICALYVLTNMQTLETRKLHLKTDILFLWTGGGEDDGMEI